MLFGQRPEDEADHDRRDRVAENPHDIAEQPEGQEHAELEHGRVCPDCSERREDQDTGIEPGLGDGQQLHPQADQRQVENEQHGIGDEERSDQPPHKLRIGGEQQRAGLQAILLEAGKHDRRRRGGRQAERQERHERAGGRCVVGCLRPCDAFDGTVAELLRMLRQSFFRRIGKEGADLRTAGRHGADREADHGAAKPGFPGAGPVLRAHPDGAFHSLHRLRPPHALRGHEERFPDGEHGDCHRRHFDAIQQVWNTEGEAGLAGQLVDTDDRKGLTDEKRSQATKRRIPEG